MQHQVNGKKDTNYKLFPLSEGNVREWLNLKRAWMYQNPEQYKKLIKELRELYSKRDF